MKLLSQAEGEVIVDNTLDLIHKGYLAGRSKKKDGSYSSSGLEVLFTDKIKDAVNKYGYDVVGTVLFNMEGLLNFDNPHYYYPARDGSDKEDLQKEAQDRFEYNFSYYLDIILSKLGDEDRELTEEESYEYNRMRKNAKNRKSYYKQKGILTEELPMLKQIGKRFLSDLTNLLEWIEWTNNG